MQSMFIIMAPMFLLLALGYVAGFFRVYQDFQGGLNAFVFYFSLPAFVYASIIDAPVPEDVPLAVFIIAAGLTTLVSVIIYYLVRLLGGSRDESAAPTSLASTFGNVGYFGIPITIAVLGTDASLPAAAVHLIHNVMFLVGYPLVRALTNEVDSSDNPPTTAGSLLKRLWPIFRKAALLNPVALAMTLALLLVHFDVQLPDSVDSSINMLGSTAIPLALFTIGLAMHHAFNGIRQGGVPLRFMSLGTVMKLIGLPAVTGLFVMLFSEALGPIWGGTLILMAAMPSSTTVFILSAQYDKNGSLAAAITALSTILSIGSVPVIAEFLL